jgi:hypothetical protein
MMNLQPRHIAFTGWFLVFMTCLAVLKISFGILTLDDAFITLSHVNTWITSGLPLMSLRNPVNACSTPLYAAVIAAAGALFGADSLEITVYAVNTFFSALALLFLFRVCRLIGMGSGWSCAVVSAVGMSTGFLIMGASGMETMLYLIIICMLMFGITPRNPASPWLICASFLGPALRPEGVLIPFVAVACMLVRRTKLRSLLVLIGAGALGFICFILFYQLSYGGFLPHSVLAKRLEFHVPLGEAFKSWIDNAFFAGPLLSGRKITGAAVLTCIVVSIAGFVRSRSRLLPLCLLAWPALYVAFFIVTGSSNYYAPWYYFPIVPVIIIVVAFGMREAVGRFRIPLVASFSIPILLILAGTAGILRSGLPEKHRLVYRDWPLRYREAIRTIEKAAAPSDVVMHNDVGAIGYFGSLRILDFAGLISPEVLPYLNTGNGSMRYQSLTKDFRPRWVIMPWIPSVPGEALPEANPLLSGPYERWLALPAASGCDVLLVWKRKNS